MALIYLLDTNVISETELMQPHPNVTARLNQYRGQIVMASVSWHELLYVYHRLPTSKRKQRVNYFITQTVMPHIPVLAYDAAAAEWFAVERARLACMGRTPSYPDGQIAAIAAVNNLTLVTRNTRDFANFTGLKMENWFDTRRSRH